MQLTDFDFKTFIVLLISFFGGCTSFQPPSPVEITTPTSVTIEKTEEAGLIIEIMDDSKIRVSYLPALVSNPKALLQKREESVIENLNTEMMVHTIDVLTEQYGIGILSDVKIKGANKANFKSFSLVTEALKNKNIYKFKLITTPQ